MIIEILKAILFGIIQGITEWLPISSTGHMIILEEFLKLNVSPDFWEMFLVVIQLASIIAVVLIYWKRLFPFYKDGEFKYDHQKTILWFKIVVACIPAAIVGLLFDDLINAYFYHFIPVAIALIVFGVAFILIERRNEHRAPVITDVKDITYKYALSIGFFQLLAAVFPGTSRSGSTILGGILLGASRTVAAEFTFFLAIPVMAGASLLKLLKFGLAFTSVELVILLVGSVVSFVVSIIAIKFLLSYIKRNDFKVFGYYRIALGLILIIYAIIR